MATTQTQTLHGKTLMPSLTVNNLNESLHFFEALGFAVDEKWEDNGTLLGCTVKAGNCLLGLNQDDGKKGVNREKGVGMSLYIETDDDIDAVAARAKAAGIGLKSEPADMEMGSRGFRVIEPSGFAITIMSSMKR
jgi:uncharacterized glyoxalase superfamily protein PhnB